DELLGALLKLNLERAGMKHIPKLRLQSLFAGVILWKGDAANKGGEPTAEMFKVGTLQNASSFCFTKFDAAVDFLSRHGEKSLEVDSQFFDSGAVCFTIRIDLL